MSLCDIIAQKSSVSHNSFLFYFWPEILYRSHDQDFFLTFWNSFCVFVGVSLVYFQLLLIISKRIFSVFLELLDSDMWVIKTWKTRGMNQWQTLLNRIFPLFAGSSHKVLNLNPWKLGSIFYIFWFGKALKKIKQSKKNKQYFSACTVKWFVGWQLWGCFDWVVPRWSKRCCNAPAPFTSGFSSASLVFLSDPVTTVAGTFMGRGAVRWKF